VQSALRADCTGRLPQTLGWQEISMVSVFDNDEENYLNWVSANQRGFVANIDRNQNMPQYPMAHLAKHKQISSKKIGNFTTGDYIKFCSDSLEELDRYAQSKYGRSLTHCSVCMRAAS
jgi:hypothetical protein